MAHPDAFVFAVLGGAAAGLIARARRRDALRRSLFAHMTREPPPDTREARSRHRWLRLRHDILQAVVPERELEDRFDQIRSAFTPQQVDYSNTAYGKNHWALSCFMEYSGGVATGKVDLAKGAPMMAACSGILEKCDAAFLEWYAEIHPCARDAKRQLIRLQSFVTRYLPRKDETHLPRHIDGANVDGSLVLGLPTYNAFCGGGLTVWDGEGDRESFEYPIGPGDACVLDSRVWHQSNPIFSGERWVVVIFYQVKTEPTARARFGMTSAAERGPSERTQAVRTLLARRMLEAKRRKEVTDASTEAATEQVAEVKPLGVAAWQEGNAKVS